MKHIKIFKESIEDEHKNSYWTIPNDERYIKSLKDIGCSNKELYHTYEDKKTALYEYTSNIPVTKITSLFTYANKSTTDLGCLTMTMDT